MKHRSRLGQRLIQHQMQRIFFAWRTVATRLSAQIYLGEIIRRERAKAYARACNEYLIAVPEA